MKVVGIRELKDRLSQYLRLARTGEPVLVADRGEVVAELRRVDPSTLSELPSGLASLVTQGNVSLAETNDPNAYPRMARLVKNLSVLQLLDEERSER